MKKGEESLDYSTCYDEDLIVCPRIDYQVAIWSFNAHTASFNRLRIFAGQGDELMGVIPTSLYVHREKVLVLFRVVVVGADRERVPMRDTHSRKT